MFEKILVPLDGSARAEQAIPLAARLAREPNGVVIPLVVASLPGEFQADVKRRTELESPELVDAW